MQFRTQIPISKNNASIDYKSDILLLGSCFAENIGSKFEYFKFQVKINPFGIIFNTVSLEKLIHRVVQKDFYAEKDISFHNDLWHCYEVHSELSHPDNEVFLTTLNTLIEVTHEQITKLSHCIITLGTSWVYRNISSGEIVANCHKVPQKEFIKELLTPEQNEQSLKNTMALIHSVNPACNFIFTISPVRHIKDGFFENNVSKGNLFSALHKIITDYYLLNTEHFKLNTYYFPSYEIVMDELRDYRFYNADMLHPNHLAVDYIWERFSETYFDSITLTIMKEVEVIQKGLSHRPFNSNTETHQKFVAQLRLKIDALKAKCPTIQF